jgi:enoyl-CoA hydratase/carnithine racemase
VSGIEPLRVSVAELDALVDRSDDLSAVLALPAAVVMPGGAADVDVRALARRLAGVPCVLLAEPDAPAELEPLVDVAPDGSSWVPTLDQIGRTPLAAVALALLLRSSMHRDVDEGLVAESATYSMLQAGPEFARWRADRPKRALAPEDHVLDVERTGDVLRITFDRPHRHNAFSRAMRDALCDALLLAVVDATITTVELRGAGPSFGSGGDLDEFGDFPDPVTSHLTRLTRSPARLLSRLRDRLVSHLHGSCLGAGIELPAFGARVVAAPDAVIGLPELELGLVPGAGGTVSLPRRIGRHRTALLALSGMRLDAGTALAWGLVDELA